MGTTRKDAPQGADIQRVRAELAARDDKIVEAVGDGPTHEAPAQPAPAIVQEPAAPAAPDRDEAGPASDQKPSSGRPPLIEVAQAAIRPVTNPTSQED